MKLPKHRANIYVVERRVLNNAVVSYAVVGVFPTSEGADYFKGACEQDFRDRGFSDDDLKNVQTMKKHFDDESGLDIYYTGGGKKTKFE